MRIAIAIEKELTWHGQAERFSNVYHYETDYTVTNSNAGAAIDALVTFEKPVHTSSVTFKVGRLWTTGGTPQQNETLLIKDLTGSGTLGGAVDLFREACVVVQSYTGRNSTTGKRIFLRKFIHSCGLPTGASSTMANGASALDATRKTPFLTYGDQIQEVVPGAGQLMTLEAPSGANLSPSAPVSVLDYVTTRQFRR
jgi:hypothetical protein